MFKGICMIFSLELKNFILSHPVTSEQPHKIVQRLMGHPVKFSFWQFDPDLVMSTRIKNSPQHFDEFYQGT